MEYGMSLFIDQLIKTLQVEQTDDPLQSRKVSGPSGGSPALSEIGKGATQHGRELLQQGFTVDQVIHDYGDVCQAVTGLALEMGTPITTDEFRTLNRCLDNAIANAVTEFNYRHNFAVADKQVSELNERLGVFAHELRNHLATATLALTIIRAGNVGLSGATGAVLDRSLLGMRNVIDRSLAEVRLSATLPAHHLFSLAEFIMEMKVSAVLDAQFRNCTLSVGAVEPSLAVEADRDLLFSALSNLLQNAFKFTRPQSTVTLNAYAAGDRILIEVEDCCGGLPPGFMETMFVPFTQGSEDRTGLGLGLSIARRSVEVNDGVLRVRDIPGSGCVFTIDLPRHSLSELPSPSLLPLN